MNLFCCYKKMLSIKHHYMKKKIITGHLNMENMTDPDYIHTKTFFKAMKYNSW